jgi:hypothetical protein
MRVLSASLAYFACVFAAGFIFGTVRVLLLERLLGPVAATIVEVPLMLAVSWFAAGFALRRFAPESGAGGRLAVGLLAFAFLLAAEAAVSVLAFGRSLAEHVAVYGETAPRIGLAAQVVFALIPLLRGSRPGR